MVLRQTAPNRTHWPWTVSCSALCREKKALLLLLRKHNFIELIGMFVGEPPGMVETVCPGRYNISRHVSTYKLLSSLFLFVSLWLLPSLVSWTTLLPSPVLYVLFHQHGEQWVTDLGWCNMVLKTTAIPISFNHLLYLLLRVHNKRSVLLTMKQLLYRSWPFASTSNTSCHISYTCH